MRDASLDSRSLLLNLFQRGLAAVDGRAVTRSWLCAHPLPGPFHLVALGKAAEAMAAGALDAAGAGLASGLLVTRRGYLDTQAHRDSRVVSLQAGHPLPDAQSLAAGQALESFLGEAPADARFLFLVSGGTSSIVESPVSDVSLVELRELNLWLLGSGLSIGDVNRVRAALSRIKGGRLAAQLKGRPTTLLLMSDVPGDVPAQIGSGLLVPCEVRPLPKLPRHFAQLPFHREAISSPEHVDVHIIASNAVARAAVVAAAQEAGHAVQEHDALPPGDAAACGEAIARGLLQAPTGIHVWGGETTMKLPMNPGQGGRNQHLALAAARLLADHDGITLLAAGTDGSDGVTDDAGALVDGGSLARGEEAGYDAADCLARADSGAFLEASGDLVHTGPTGSNVMDLIIGYRQ